MPHTGPASHNAKFLSRAVIIYVYVTVKTKVWITLCLLCVFMCITTIDCGWIHYKQGCKV